VFEFESDRLGAQAALGGGGRYDGLVEELGGPPTPGIGWAAGVERMLLAAEASGEDERADAFVAVADDAGDRTAFQLLLALRREGLRAEMEQAGRGMKGQLKQADRIGAGATVIVGAGLEVKNMQTGEQRPADGVDAAVAMVRKAVGK
jgi:histidyl-tRNA synthetase